MKTPHARFLILLTAGLAHVASFASLSAAASESNVPGALSQHWAFAPLARPMLPPRAATATAQNPVDRFWLAALTQRGISPAPPASRLQLVRRLTLDLTGLPPTPAEMDAYVQDDAPDAYAKLVERLLASPHYGERWARHWLDLARYGESDGFEHDAVRPNSWRYRDYVIDAFNRDKPYDRFLQEQIAGDEFWPGQPEALVATGFNLLGPDMVDSADQTQRRLNTLNDMTDTTAAVVLGLTFGCARCHDHKTEPLTQRDYYRWQAFYANAVFDRDALVPTPEQTAAHEVARRQYDTQTAEQRQALQELEAPIRRQLFEQKLATLSEDAQLAHRTARAQRTKEQEATVQETAGMVKITDAEVARAIAREEQPRHKALLQALNRLAKPPPLPTAMVLRDTNGPAPKTFVLGRGDYNNPKEEVQPGFPVVLTQQSPSAPQEQGGSRRALARWLTNPQHPMTARVFVNRLWQHHFGRGLMMTPSDFGIRSQRPSHPELLDWLATEFIRSGWSIKSMHRLLLNSMAYQQSSEPSAQTRALDPDNHWFSRQNRTRLEGEVLRDSLLAISGRLNRTVAGPSVFPPIPADITRVSKNWSVSDNRAEHGRRSIYIFARRNLRYPFLEAFDSPDSNFSCPERGRSTTAPQSLTLLNSEMVLEAARQTAAELQTESSSPQQQIQQAYRLILGRAPTAEEAALSRPFLDASTARSQKANPSQAGLTELCRALFNLNAFVYAD
jgi:hypothetical protein